VPKGAMLQWDGASEVGKTTMLLELMRALCTGGTWLDQQAEKTPVLLLSEQPTVSLKFQARKLLALDDFHVIPAYVLASKKWDEIAAIAVRETLHFGATLFIDNPLAFMGLKEGGENDSATIAAMLKPLVNAVAEHGFSTHVIRHQNWTGRSRGSTQWVAGVDHRYSMSHDNDADSTRRVLTMRGRFEDMIPRRLVIERKPGGEWISHGDTRSTTNKATEPLLEAMPESEAKALTREELMKKASVNNETAAKRVLKKLVEAGTIKTRGKGVKNDALHYWRQL
jgi:AAA domain